jgi:hypothetical protein
MTAIPSSTKNGYAHKRGDEAFNPPIDGFVAEYTAPYWTWKRLSMFVLTVKNGRTPTPGAWHALQRGIPSLSLTKKAWLYRQLKSYFSTEVMKYLFSGWSPPAAPMGLDPWL